MKLRRSHLLAATAASVLSAGVAHAQAAPFNYAPATFYGNGASLPAFAVRQALDCYAGNEKLLFSGGVATTVAPYAFVGPNTTLNPNFNCASENIQDPADVRGWYLSTGSGGGVSNWRTNSVATGVFPTVDETGAPYSDPQVPFPDIHYALSESPITAGDIVTYNEAAWGQPIQFPILVAPVTIAYDPVYRVTAGGVARRFNLATPVVNARGDGSGGLRVDRATYCSIFDPANPNPITNWNDLRIRAFNGSTVDTTPQTPNNASLQDPAEAAAGIPFDVPIFPVGRSESSGTTTLWTRHLAAVCGTGTYTAGGTGLLPAATLSGVTYDKAANTFSTTTFVPNRYIVANGSDGVAEATDALVPDTNPNNPGGQVNGKIAYLSPDFTLPVTALTGGLNTVSIRQGTGTLFVAPKPAEATKAFGAVLPPQTQIGTTGKYNPVTPAPTSVGDRADPLAWVPTTAIANPATGYPIIGTNNALLYTCYANADQRRPLVQFFSVFMGKVTKDFTGTTSAANIPAALFTDTLPATAPRGLLAKNGFAPLPGAWRNAITETFLKRSTQPGNFAGTTNLGARNLWIQSKLPTTATGTGAVNDPNPTCAGLVGAGETQGVASDGDY